MNAEQAKTGRPKGTNHYTWETDPKDLSNRAVKSRLCSAGPYHCPKCESKCGYGVEWMRRMKRKEAKKGA